MPRLPLLVLLPTLVVGCKSATNAPIDEPQALAVKEATTTLFSAFDDATDAELALAAESLFDASNSFDWTASARDRAVDLDPLTADQLGGVTGPPGVDPLNQIPIVVFGESEHPYADNVATALEANQVCIESDSTTFYARTYLTDDGCTPEGFADGSCDVLRSENSVRKENALAKAWYTLKKDFRRIQLPQLGTEAIVARSWIEQRFPGDNCNTEFAQNYTVEAWIPDHGGQAFTDEAAQAPADVEVIDKTRRIYGFWAEINLGLGDDIMRGLIVDGIGEGMENADGFTSGASPNGDGGYCGTDRAASLERVDPVCE